MPQPRRRYTEALDAVQNRSEQLSWHRHLSHLEYHLPRVGHDLGYHAIFSTEDRRPSIKEDFRDRLLGHIGGILDRHDLVCDDRFANG